MKATRNTFAARAGRAILLITSEGLGDLRTNPVRMPPHLHTNVRIHMCVLGLINRTPAFLQHPANTTLNERAY